MRPYAERKAARIERLRARAERKQAEAAGAYEAADRIARNIPLGQPLLIGHHSERHHRRDLARIDRGMRRSVEATKAADELARRAAAAEANTAISPDDPTAADQIRAKIAQLEAGRELARAINARVQAARRRHQRAGTDWKPEAYAALAAMGVRTKWIRGFLEADYAGRYGVPDYRLKNDGAEIRRLQARLADLERRATAPAVEDLVIDTDAGTVRIADAENRTRIYFPGKPAEAVRRELKSYGYRWAPSEGAWQRHASPQARYWAEQIVRRHYVERASA
jgi:hypothetical protein